MLDAAARMHAFYATFSIRLTSLRKRAVRSCKPKTNKLFKQVHDRQMKRWQTAEPLPKEKP
jgi:hypothetical protein